LLLLLLLLLFCSLLQAITSSCKQGLTSMVVQAARRSRVIS
jgi:hypothetical protein